MSHGTARTYSQRKGETDLHVLAGKGKHTVNSPLLLDMYLEYSHVPETVLLENRTAYKDNIPNFIRYARPGIPDIIMSDIYHVRV